MFAKTDENGVVVNVQMMSSSDAQDPAFVWVDIAELSPRPGIGWTYSEGVFTPPAEA